MLHIIELSRQAGFHYLWLSVWQQNDRAIKFYKDFGFEIIGVKKFFIGKEVNDDYVMGLKL
jgi:ribosomal protein S18 acetylase RimI-like enzyme